MGVGVPAFIERLVEPIAVAAAFARRDTDALFAAVPPVACWEQTAVVQIEGNLGC